MEMETLQTRINDAADRYGDTQSHDVIAKVLGQFTPTGTRSTTNYWNCTPVDKPHIWKAFQESRDVQKILERYFFEDKRDARSAGELLVDGLVMLKVALRAEISQQERTRVEKELLELSDVLTDLEDRIGN